MKHRLTLLHPFRIPLMTAGLLGILGGCTTYQPQPLADQSPLVTEASRLQTDASVLPATTSAYSIDLSDGLNLTETGIIAVLNNPDLRVQRAQLKVAGSQAFAAGLLPDPVISTGFDKPMNNDAPATAWLLGLDYDIIPLITRQAQIDAARSAQEKVRLDLLWQEWQVIQQARSLAVRLQLEDQRLALLRSIRTHHLQRYRQSAEALKEGNTTLDITGTDLTALLDTLSQINRLEQTHNQTRHQFNLLLGLDPQATVPISPLPRQVQIDPETLQDHLFRIAQVRPDLLALKAGYESQEARVRAAILAQFPSLGIGINRARDNDNVNTMGLSISLTLPLFSGNRGNIAIERASREQLREEYQARLAQTSVDVDRLLELQTILQRQQDELQIYLPRLQILLEQAHHAYEHSDIDALTYLNMESTWVNKRLEQISLLQAAWENHIALEALLALPGYPVPAAP